MIIVFTIIIIVFHDNHNSVDDNHNSVDHVIINNGANDNELNEKKY